MFRFLFLICVLACVQLEAVQRGSRSNEDPYAVAFSDVKNSVETLRYEVRNQGEEIHVFDEKLNTLDTILESIRSQLSEATKDQRDQIKGSTTALEGKILALETTSKGLVADVRQFQTHANESAVVLTQYKQKLIELEKVIAHQAQDIEHLQATLRTLVDLIQGKGAVADAKEGEVYKVQSGDNLEKIAKAHGVTIQALKECNGLTNDRIVVGKVLKIPGR